jgi:hypothetical protein
MSLLDELSDLEHLGWAALCAGTGHEFYGDLMTENGLMVFPGGMIMDRDQVVAALADSPPWLRFEIRHERLVETPDGAALVYLASAWRSADELPFEAAMSSLYVRGDGRWRLALYQQTPVIT